MATKGQTNSAAVFHGPTDSPKETGLGTRVWIYDSPSEAEDAPLTGILWGMLWGALLWSPLFLLFVV